jgi:hypothetical protein
LSENLSLKAPRWTIPLRMIEADIESDIVGIPVPYEMSSFGANPARVSITPGNGRKGESATDISN